MLKSVLQSKLLLLFLSLFSLQNTSATDVQSAQKILEDMTLTYSQVAYMKNSFERKEVSQLLGTEKKTKGDIEYSKKKIRVEFKKGSKALFIKGDKKFWHADGEGNVLTGMVSKSVPNIFVSIFSDPSIWKGLGTKHLDVPKRNIAHLEVDPKGKFPSIDKMKLKIDTKKRTLLELFYVDDIGNSTEVTFRNNRFFPKEKPGRFVYTFKKKDVVTRM